jgi:hypothetical protein
MSLNRAERRTIQRQVRRIADAVNGPSTNAARELQDSIRRVGAIVDAGGRQLNVDDVRDFLKAAGNAADEWTKASVEIHGVAEELNRLAG